MQRYNAEPWVPAMQYACMQLCSPVWILLKLFKQALLGHTSPSSSLHGAGQPMHEPHAHTSSFHHALRHHVR